MTAETSKRPNILFIMTDQQQAGCLSFLGHPIVKTPNLDRLAARGCYFSNMFTCSAICSPSRASFFTGTYLRTHQQYNNSANYRRDLPSLVGELKKAGYQCGQTGKNHLAPQASRYFDKMWTADTTYKQDLQRAGFEVPKMSRLEHKNFHSNTSPLPEEQQIEVWTADRSIEFIEEAAGNPDPFFLWCSFQRPHSPHTPPASFDDLYDPDDVPVDWEEFEAFENSRLMNRPMMEEFWSVGSVRQNPRVFQKAVCRHLALIALIDREVGRILESLEKAGVADETIVVFTSDHGDFAGRYGLLGKNLPAYDDLIRIPFLYYDPARKTDDGRRIATQFQSIDLFPSLMERVGLEIPPSVEGISFLPALDGVSGCGREYVFAESLMEKTIRSTQWKLTYFARHPERGQLFRMGSQPDEINNLWDEPGLQPIRERLLSRLILWMVECEQSTGSSGDWEEVIPTRWNQWLESQPGGKEWPEEKELFKIVRRDE